ncbi:hypothetical protein GCM10009654_13790 [Streptomyces hebeiensis]|uniref:Uncharacterized protein n=1 Tax=Streptomyces hebeiensis TaxID=229486 RepID=A0ABN1UNZ8_9ACTN
MFGASPRRQARGDPARAGRALRLTQALTQMTAGRGGRQTPSPPGAHRPNPACPAQDKDVLGGARWVTARRAAPVRAGQPQLPPHWQEPPDWQPQPQPEPQPQAARTVW